MQEAQNRSHISESAEAEFVLSMAAAAPAEVQQALGMRQARIAGGVVTAMQHDPTGGFWNKALGFGFDQAFANIAKDGTTVTQSFIKLNDRQFIELYPVTDRDTQVEFLHLCFEGADLNAIHDYYVAEGLTPISVRTAGAGNLLFTMKGPQQFADPQNIEYTQYMPGSKHTVDFGQHLGPDRVGDKMTVVALAMQDPAAARTYYLTKLGFTLSKTNPARLELPGTPSEAVEIVPVDALGAKSSIVLASSNLDKAAAQLTRQQVAFKRAAAESTANGKTTHIEMISVTDPDGNIIRISSAPATHN